MAKIKVEIPDYFSVRHYKALGNFEHLDEVETVAEVVLARI